MSSTGNVPSDADATRTSAGRTPAEPATAPSARLRPGTAEGPREFGHYEIRDELGRGGMGVVYRAFDRNLRRPVALKVLLAGTHASPEDVARFAREARTAAQLSHPNIVPIFDVGEHDGYAFYTMGLIEGTSLLRLMRERKRLGARAAVEIAVRIARALQHAHAHGVVHRDVKPANVLLAAVESGSSLPADVLLEGGSGAPAGHRVLVADFGLAKSVEPDANLTASGQILGTPVYMAPEQAIGDLAAIGPPCDVYALGTLLYEMLTGATPFTSLVEKVEAAEAPSPRRSLPTLNRDLETILLKSLEKDPSRRYPNGGELAEDLDRFLRGEAVLARPPSRLDRAWRFAARRRAVVVPSALFLLAAAGLGTYEAFQPGVVTLRVSPPHAVARLDERRWDPGSGALSLRLPAGVHRLSIEAADHDTRELVLEVKRRSSQTLAVELTRHTGRLTVLATPPGSVVVVGGVAHGTPLRDLALPTGEHALEVEALDHYRRTLRVTVARDDRIQRELILPRCDLWYSPQSDWGGDDLTVDIDGDGIRDFTGGNRAGQRFVFSGRSGQVLARYSMPSGPGRSAQFCDLDGDGRPELVLAYGDNPAGEPKLAAVRLDSPPKTLWVRRDLGRLRWVRDLPGEAGAGAALLVAEEDGALRLLAGADGSSRWEKDLAGASARRISFDGDGDRAPDVLLEKGRSLSLLSARSGTVLWSLNDRAPGRLIFLRGGTEFAVLGDEEWSWYALADGRLLRTRRVDTPLPDGPIAALDADGLWIAADADGLQSAWDLSEGRRLWTRNDTGRLWTGDRDPRWSVSAGSAQVHFVLAHLPDGVGPTVFTLAEDRRTLRATDARTGTDRWTHEEPDPILPDLRWTVPGDGDRVDLLLCAGSRALRLDPATGNSRGTMELHQEITMGARAADIDGDGQTEYHYGLVDGLITALDREGRVLHAVRVEPPVYALHFFHADQDGILDLGISTAGLRVIRGPKQLWSRRMTNAVRPGPLLVDADRDGTPDVIVPAHDRHGRSGLRAFRGRTGELLWEAPYREDGNRAPALADTDRDGNPEIVAWRYDDGEAGSVLVIDPASGRIRAERSLPHRGYATPAVADLDGDGADDLIVCAWYGPATVTALRGTDLATLWEFPARAPVWGRPIVTDVDGDGRPEVFLATRGGAIVSLDGSSGKIRWQESAGAGVAAELAVASPGRGRPPRVVAAGADGRLLALEALDGKAAWTAAIQAASGACWADADRDNRRELFVGVQDGLCCLDPDGTVIWRTTGDAVVHVPRVADLDGDGRLEVIAGTNRGDLLCLEAATGALRWRVEAGNMPEDPPGLADLDGDGVLDVVLTGHGQRIDCYSGRGRLPEGMR